MRDPWFCHEIYDDIYVYCSLIKKYRLSINIPLFIIMPPGTGNRLKNPIQSCLHLSLTHNSKYLSMCCAGMMEKTLIRVTCHLMKHWWYAFMGLKIQQDYASIYNWSFQVLSKSLVFLNRQVWMLYKDFMLYNWDDSNPALTSDRRLTKELSDIDCPAVWRIVTYMIDWLYSITNMLEQN